MGFSFFPKKGDQTLKSLIKDIANIEDRLGTLRGELNDVRGAAVAASEAAERLVFERKPTAEIEAAHALLAQSEASAKTLTSVIRRYEQALAQKRAEHDSIVRAELAAKLANEHEAALHDYQAAALAAVDAISALIAPAEKIGGLSFAAAEIAGFAQSICRDLALSVDHTAAELAYLIDGLRNGSIAPSMPVEHEPVAAIEVAPVIPTRRVVALADCKWQHGGELRAAAKDSQVDLPVATADRAVAAGRAAEVGSPAWLKHNAGRLIQVDPRTTGLIDLDADDLRRPTPAFGNDQGVAAGGIVEVISYQR
ncbi:hypothetical protein [Bradyrhizobium sp. C9]|uniref:hypothetical protein n=1 Tax=Bradyrhizobium sp. C9 TaxID=142585 RepID=UPI000BE993C6|nr:hypothetical protein [Bradyrhizobium sp. C9]PDT75089.1 hypothetical protein CO675_22695 [Bradyrhizobium sp. C9]